MSEEKVLYSPVTCSSPEGPGGHGKCNKSHTERLMFDLTERVNNGNEKLGKVREETGRLEVSRYGVQ